MKQINNSTINLISYFKISCIYSLILIIINFPVLTIAEMIDPEIYIQKNGYQTQRLGDDGKTPFYNFTERTNATRVTSLEKDINSLPKHKEVLKYCDFMRGATKAKLIQSTGKAIDVAVSNYGYKGSTTACVLKYMYGGDVGTQLIYTKKSRGSMYMVFVTH